MNDAAAQSGEAFANGLRLHFLRWEAEGQWPMVLLHGTASHAHVWDDFAPRFAHQYDMIAPDQRGHGDSESPPDYTSGYPKDIWVSDLRAVVNQLRLAPITLVGVSAGGNSAIHFAASFPEAVTRLVVVEMGPEAAREGVTRVIQSIPGEEEFESLEAGIQYLTRAGGRSDPALGRSHAIHALRPIGNGRVALKGDPALRRRDWRRPLRTAAENWEAVRAVACPTLLVRGAESKLLTDDLARQIEREMKDCTLVTIDGAGHAVPLHRPSEFARAVGDWLKARATD